jgi:hypothetical protein
VCGLTAIMILSINLDACKLSSTYLIKGLPHNSKRGFSQGTLSLVPIPPDIKIA